MQTKKLKEAREFLSDLAEKPPWVPYEPALLPLLFTATREDSTTTIKELTALIERSQKLAARVLSIANSAVYALESTVTSLSRAISVLGLREVRTLVVMVGAASAIKGVKLPKEFDSSGLWKHQLKTACVAKALTGYLNDAARTGQLSKTDTLEIQPDEAYVTGLLHDIGKVFLASVKPEIWLEIQHMSSDMGISFAEAEDVYWEMDHALVGAQVLHYWKIPLLLTDPINWHHAPHLAPALKAETNMLAAANLIAHHEESVNGELPDAALLLLPKGTDVDILSATLKEAFAGDKSQMFNSLMD